VDRIQEAPHPRLNLSVETQAFNTIQVASISVMHKLQQGRTATFYPQSARREIPLKHQ
jgi:hypothetical protein